MVAKETLQSGVLAILDGVPLVDRSGQQVLVHVDNAWIVPDGEAGVRDAREHVVRVVPDKVVDVCAQRVDLAGVADDAHIRDVEVAVFVDEG